MVDYVRRARFQRTKTMAKPKAVPVLCACGQGIRYPNTRKQCSACYRLSIPRIGRVRSSMTGLVKCPGCKETMVRRGQWCKECYDMDLLKRQSAPSFDLIASKSI